MNSQRHALLSVLCVLFFALTACSSSPKQAKPKMNPTSPVLSGNNYEYDPAEASVANARLGIEYMKQGKYKIALMKLQKALQQDDNNFEAHTTIALLHERLGQKNLAERHFEQALDLAPEDASIHNNYGSYLCRQQKLKAAQQHFLRALNNPLYETPELVHTNAGLCALRFNQQQQAIDSFSQALQKNPKFSVALYQMSALNEKMGNVIEANQYFQRYEKVARHTPQTLWLGVRIARALGERDREANYALLLKSQYPETEPARLLQLFEQGVY